MQPKARLPPGKARLRRRLVAGSANGTLHLELDEPVHLDGVLERELLRDRLDEARDDHCTRLRLREAAAHEVEELLLADLRDRRLVPELDVRFVDLDVRIRV